MEQRISNTITDLDTRIGFRFDNLEARVANSHSKGDIPIRPIRGATGAVANGFPSSWVAFHRLTVQQLQDLLAFYGVESENDTKPALKRAFARFTSLITSITREERNGSSPGAGGGVQNASNKRYFYLFIVGQNKCTLL